MSTLLPYLIEASVALILFYAAWWVLFRQEQCFRFSRLYLLGSSILAVLLPLLHIAASSYALPDSADWVYTLPGLEIRPGGEARLGADPWANRDLLQVWGLLYGTGVLLLLLRFAWRGLNLLRLYRKAQSCFIAHGIRLIELPATLPAFSFFNTIWIGSQPMSEADRAQILQHERCHIQERHSLDVLWFELLKIIFWFNPLIYAYRQSTELLHEYIADQSVSQQHSPEVYADLLARQVLSGLQPALVHAFGKAPILKRLQMIHKPIKQTPMMKYLLTIPVMALAIFLVACEEESSTPLSVAPAEKQLSLPASSSEEVFQEVDQMPSPVDGLQSYYTQIAETMEYPIEAKENGTEGKVFIEFIINKQGVAEKFKVVKSLKPDCDQEALRVVSSNGMRWNPGIKDQKVVNTRVVLPISFKLDD